MTEPKHQIGDRVMVRSDIANIDSAYITDHKIVPMGTLLPYSGGVFFTQEGDNHYYMVDAGDFSKTWFAECYVFPYQPPPRPVL